MEFKEAMEGLNSGIARTTKKTISEIEKDESLKNEILNYYSDIFKATGFKAIKDIGKIPRRLITKKVTAKSWEPNAYSIDILNNITIDSCYISSDQIIPDWFKHVNFVTLTIQHHTEDELVFPRSVKRLNIEHCGLTEVPEVLKELKSEWIGLMDNRIPAVPEWVYEFPDRLDLSENLIEKVELDKDCSIKLLRLNGNKISDLDFLHHFPKLDFLVLSGNPVDDFPELNNSLLEKLHLSDCKFRSIPASINLLKKLTVLAFDGNPIDQFPKLDLPNLEYFNIESSPIGKKYNVTETLSSPAEIMEFLNKNKSIDNGFTEICKILESGDSEKICEVLEQLKQNGGDRQKAEKRYLKFIQARLGTDATILDFEKAALSEEEIKTLSNIIVHNKGAINLAYFDDEQSKLVVDFLGSMIESVTDLEDLKTELLACTTEEALVNLGNSKIFEIKNAVSDSAIIYKDGWFGKLLYEFSIFSPSWVLFDHTSFNSANNSLRINAFFIFLQCFGYDDCSLDVFQSDCPKLGDYFWLLPNIPKIVWGDTVPEYPVSYLSFKRAASLSENNQGKQIKSALAV